MSELRVRPTNRARRILALSGLAVWLASCSPAPRTVPAEVTDQSQRLQQAGGLVAKGHYLAFKEACRIYGPLYALPSLRPKVAAPYLEACLLLALREKQIGMDNPATMAAAARILKENASLSGLADCATLIAAIPPRSRGVMRDIDTSTWNKSGADALKAAEEAVRKRAAASELAAYVLAAWSCGHGRYSEEWRDPAELLKAFPDSLLLKYAVATCGEGRPDLLEEILAREPGFAEAHYHMGESALEERKLLTAETHLLAAYRAIPESPQTRILLAGIYFATEEFDSSLKFYDLTLEISPEFRDALLGKAVCLGYLGRFEESMAVLGRILELGYWLLGEAHYWLAWDLHELKRDGEALGHVDQAKGRLPTDSEVFGLAGTLSLGLGEIGRAEADFLESLKYNPQNVDSLFGLGTVAGRKTLWLTSAGFYEKAAGACESSAAALRAKIEEIRVSPMSEGRKGTLARRRQAQIDRLELTRATAYYDAAAALAKAGLWDRAAAAAEKAAVHPALKQKADELVRSIRK
jgi:tetratricopeptide (TPR) repeat protein